MITNLFLALGLSVACGLFGIVNHNVDYSCDYSIRSSNSLSDNYTPITDYYYGGYNDYAVFYYNLERYEQRNSLFVDRFAPNVSYYFDKNTGYALLTRNLIFNGEDDYYNAVDTYQYRPSVTNGNTTTRYFKGGAFFYEEDNFLPYYTYNTLVVDNNSRTSGYRYYDSSQPFGTFGLSAIFVKEGFDYTSLFVTRSYAYDLSHNANSIYTIDKYNLYVHFNFYNKHTNNGVDYLQCDGSYTFFAGSNTDTRIGTITNQFDLSTINQSMVDFDAWTYTIEVLPTNLGYDAGFQTGYTSGYNTGYDAGYNEGMSNTSFIRLLFSIADTPVLMLRSLFNFDVLGVNLFVVALGLVTGIFVLYLVKKFLL